MKIHFICSGNTNRSRLAEAYCNSKQISTVIATSSGIYADNNLNGDICWYALEILKETKLLGYTARTWTKTTLEIIQANDCIIFIQAEHYNFVKKHFKFEPEHYEIWDIPDIPRAGLFETKKNQAKKLEADKRIFALIQAKVDGLIKSLA